MYFPITNTIKEIYIILNLELELFLKLEADCWQNNLTTIKEVAIIISNKYDKSRFCNHVLVYCHPENNNN